MRTFHGESSLFNGAKDRETQMRLAGLLGGHAPDDVCAIVNCLLGMERALFAGESLVDDLCVLCDAQIGQSVGVGAGDRRAGEEAGGVTEGRACETPRGGRQHCAGRGVLLQPIGRVDCAGRVDRAVAGLGGVRGLLLMAMLRLDGLHAFSASEVKPGSRKFRLSARLCVLSKQPPTSLVSLVLVAIHRRD